MDITLIRTFLDVAETGSFKAASDRQFVTQSAVSLRIQRLEDELGRPLFQRSKNGAELTPAGTEFQHYAISILKLLEEARLQIALPEGYDRTLVIGAQYSLWPRLGFRWIDRIQELAPSLSIRTELGMPDRLTRFLAEGVIQCALVYAPQLRPGLSAQRVMEEELVLVASWPNPTMPLDGRYVYVDWGPEFARAHALGLPDLHNSGLTMSLGALASDYILHRRAAAYLPARAVQRDINAGRLHLVPDAPRFPYPVWSVWRDDCDPIVRAAATTALTEIVDGLEAETDNLLEKLADLSSQGEVSVMGQEPPKL